MGKLSKTVVHGTPVNHVGPAGAFIGGREGYSPGKPQGMDQTVHENYRSDNRGYQPNPAGGTPYNSQVGNPDEARRVAQGTGRYGVVLSENGQDHNDPKANGSGTILDGADRYANGYMPKAAPTLDSPVPRNAPVFDGSFIPREDAAHEGTSNEAGARDDLIKVGGVMSR